MIYATNGKASRRRRSTMPKPKKKAAAEKAPAPPLANPKANETPEKERVAERMRSLGFACEAVDGVVLFFMNGGATEENVRAAKAALDAEGYNKSWGVHGAK